MGLNDGMPIGRKFSDRLLGVSKDLQIAGISAGGAGGGIDQDDIKPPHIRDEQPSV